MLLIYNTISQLHLVCPGLHLVTYLNHCSKSWQLFIPWKWWRLKNNWQVHVNVRMALFVISRITYDVATPKFPNVFGVISLVCKIKKIKLTCPRTEKYFYALINSSLYNLCRKKSYTCKWNVLMQRAYKNECLTRQGTFQSKLPGFCQKIWRD